MRRRIDIRIPFTDFSFIMISVLMILISMGYFEGKIGEKSYSKYRNEVIEKAKKEEKRKIKELFKIGNREASENEKIEVAPLHNKTQLNQDIKNDEKILSERVTTIKSSQKSEVLSREKEIEDNKKPSERNIGDNSQVAEMEEELSKHDYIDLR